MRFKSLKQPTRIANRRGVAIIYVFVIATFVGAIGVAVARVSRNETLIVSSEQRSYIAKAAATGAAHRGVALLRRDPRLIGAIAVRGPEASLGVTTAVDVSQRSDGKLVVSAGNLSRFSGYRPHHCRTIAALTSSAREFDNI